MNQIKYFLLSAVVMQAIFCPMNLKLNTNNKEIVPNNHPGHLLTNMAVLRKMWDGFSSEEKLTEKEKLKKFTEAIIAGISSTLTNGKKKILDTIEQMPLYEIVHFLVTPADDFCIPDSSQVPTWCTRRIKAFMSYPEGFPKDLYNIMIAGFLKLMTKPNSNGITLMDLKVTMASEVRLQISEMLSKTPGAPGLDLPVALRTEAKPKAKTKERPKLSASIENGQIYCTQTESMSNLPAIISILQQRSAPNPRHLKNATVSSLLLPQGSSQHAGDAIDKQKTFDMAHDIIDQIGLEEFLRILIGDKDQYGNSDKKEISKVSANLVMFICKKPDSITQELYEHIFAILRKAMHVPENFMDSESRSRIQTLIDSNQFIENGKLTDLAKTALSEVVSILSKNHFVIFLKQFGIFAMNKNGDKPLPPCDTADKFLTAIHEKFFFTDDSALRSFFHRFTKREDTPELEMIPDRSMNVLLVMIKIIKPAYGYLVIDAIHAINERRCDDDLLRKFSPKTMVYANTIFEAINSIATHEQSENYLEDLLIKTLHTIQHLRICHNTKERMNFIAMLFNYVFNNDALKIMACINHFEGPQTDALKAIFHEVMLPAITENPVSDDESDEKPIRLLPTFNVGSKTDNPADDKKDISDEHSDESGSDLDVPQNTGASSSNQLS